MTDQKQTKAAQTNADISALLKSRHSLIWIVSREEGRVEKAILESAEAAKYLVRYWDCYAGITDDKGKGVGNVTQNPEAALTYIRDSKDRYLYVLRDIHRWEDPITIRALRSVARTLQTAKPNEARTLVVICPSGKVPAELADHATVVTYPLPERVDIERSLDTVLEALPTLSLPEGIREAAVDAALGLTAEEAANCFAKSLVSTKQIDPKVIAGEKKRVIERERLLTWQDPDPRGLDAVGGLDILKQWLVSRKTAFSSKARAYGLPVPKGVLLAGPPGGGKSLTAKCIASAWGLPLLRLDLGALKSKYVGDSEQNIRKALAIAEAVAPAILMVDEIEKALAGSTGQQGDGGVSSDALGTLLTWMQEKAGSVFLVATANRVDNLPPELLRKGRFDEIFFVDLPSRRDRAEILLAALKEHNRSPENIAAIDLNRVAEETEGFVGAEIAALVPDALYVSFADGERDVTTGDLLRSAKTVVPLSKTAEEKIKALREWAVGRARPASSPEVEKPRGVRDLDIS